MMFNSKNMSKEINLNNVLIVHTGYRKQKDAII